MPHLGRALTTCARLSTLYTSNDTLMVNAAVSIKGTPAAEWDRNTWPVLDELARNHPEAGIHFQSKATSTAEDERVLLMLTDEPPRNENIQSQERHWLDNSFLAR